MKPAVEADSPVTVALRLAVSVTVMVRVLPTTTVAKSTTEAETGAVIGVP